MFSAFKGAIASSLISASVFCTLIAAVHADERAWRVEKSTGEVWVSHGGAQQVSLGAETDLTAGDNIRTGRNGRVLLVRGEERILISPNSAIGIPNNNGQLPTTISQQAGSILLEVEKKNVQHFEVETPYLAAVVKGTQFRVSVDRRGAKVDVLRGQVQVADFKSGQNALVMPGQAARVIAHGQRGLFLSGKGQLNPIEHGAPRTPSVQALVVPKAGRTAPSSAASRLTMGSDKANHAFAKETAVHKISKGGVRIGAPLGELKLDVHKVTKGLAHSSSDRTAASSKEGPNGLKGAASSSSAGADGSSEVANGSGTANANGAGGGSAASANGNGNSSGNGNAGGNGNGNGNGGGNGNAGGNGHGKAKGKNG